VSFPFVLIVDDERFFRESVADFLRGEGFRVRSAVSGIEALRIIEQEQPDLVLLDMHMPVMDGWTFARELRIRGLNIPIMAMTSAEEARSYARAIEAASYVVKPVSLPLLLQRLESVLGQRQL